MKQQSIKTINLQWNLPVLASCPPQVVPHLPTPIATNTVSSSLNYQTGTPGFQALKLCVGHHTLQLARASNDLDRNNGKRQRDKYSTMKRLDSAGELFKKAGTFEIGQDLLDEYNVRAAKKKKEEEVKIQEAESLRNDHIRAASRLKFMKPNEEKWLVPDFRTALRAFKKDSDGANPTRRSDLQNLWNRVKERDNPEFLVMSVQELTDTNDNASNAVEVDQKGVNLAEKTAV